MELRNKYMIYISAIIFALISVATYAFIIGNDRVVNNLKSNYSNDIEINEIFKPKPLEPGAIIPKEANVENKGDIDLFVRVSLDEYLNYEVDCEMVNTMPNFDTGGGDGGDWGDGPGGTSISCSGAVGGMPPTYEYHDYVHYSWNNWKNSLIHKPHYTSNRQPQKAYSHVDPNYPHYLVDITELDYTTRTQFTFATPGVNATQSYIDEYLDLYFGNNVTQDINVWKTGGKWFYNNEDGYLYYSDVLVANNPLKKSKDFFKQIGVNTAADYHHSMIEKYELVFNAEAVDLQLDSLISGDGYNGWALNTSVTTSNTYKIVEHLKTLLP